jgi:glycosyltransferase involved in cell wall biosynthesis
VRIAISNFHDPVASELDFASLWEREEFPRRGERLSLFEQPVDWGFHIYSIGVYLMDTGEADRVEFWDYQPERRLRYTPGGVLKMWFHNERDLACYLERYGYPDLYINHGRRGQSVLRLLEGRCFRVHVPADPWTPEKRPSFSAECFLVDNEEHLHDRSMVYTPVAHLRGIRPSDRPKERDFVYLAFLRPNKRHDIVVDAVRETELTGHFHPVDGSLLDLSGTKITTSNLHERDVVELLQTSRIAVYPGDRTTNPAAMWECVAAGLPIVVNADIDGGKHLVVPGVTGELATAETFGETMRRVLRDRDRYAPREWIEENWDTIPTIERYLDFFARMGWER